MNTLKHNISAILISLILLTFQQALFAEMYKWVDENNITHYTQEKPVKFDSKKLAEPTPRPTPVSTSKRQVKKSIPKQPSAEELKKKLSHKGQNLQRCSVARKNLLLLNKPHNVIRKNVKGKLQTVSFNERGILIKKQKQDIDRYCKGA